MDQSSTALAPRGMDLGQPVIDVDIHCNVPSYRALYQLPTRAKSGAHGAAGAA